VNAHELAAVFEEHRPQMIRIAYAILGSRVEAEDVVAECWPRLTAAHEREPVRDVVKWLTVAVARAAVDVLRSARVRREVYPGPWLPEPFVTPYEPATTDPADRVMLAETVSYALLVMLETMSPAERTAWVLHDVFGMRFAEGAPRFEVDSAAHEAVLHRFLAAATGGDLDALVRTLAPDAALTSDGGGTASAARRPVHGAAGVARFMIGITARLTADDRIVLIGAPAIATYTADTVTTLVMLTVSGDTARRVDILREPNKLAAVTITGEAT
jgi:RNA polymerase sigma-70 factor (ECF subfamily)